MKSEKNQRRKIQIRDGRITQLSYLFFNSKLGDLLLEPGDEIILIARGKTGTSIISTSMNMKARLKDKAFFEKVKTKLNSSHVLDRLKDKTTTDDIEWKRLRTAIYEVIE